MRRRGAAGTRNPIVSNLAILRPTNGGLERLIAENRRVSSRIWCRRFWYNWAVGKLVDEPSTGHGGHSRGRGGGGPWNEILCIGQGERPSNRAIERAREGGTRLVAGGG